LTHKPVSCGACQQNSRHAPPGVLEAQSMFGALADLSRATSQPGVMFFLRLLVSQASLLKQRMDALGTQ